MTEAEFKTAVATGRMMKRADGTYVDTRSFGFLPGFNSKVQTGALPASNITREYSEEVAEDFFRDDRAVKTNCEGNAWRN